EEGVFYLLFLRLVPLFPFSLINISMGLTPMKTKTFLLVSWVGMMPGTALYINAGLQLSKLHTIKDIFSPSLMVSLGLLGIFPLMAGKIITGLKKRKSVHKSNT
ncbi:MAG: VTT domain-containing protein, partial [Halobacteriovoraceae bacterium]|nr:VTT domain-containing protein [Halobacteriovoraceae bacterium]